MTYEDLLRRDALALLEAAERAIKVVDDNPGERKATADLIEALASLARYAMTLRATIDVAAVHDQERSE